ncbi:MAG: hypothetical protein K2J07_02520, partial [Muribaculaceae bacterium]|nr:hypothetical protein [Muribaculaceae bacterium]
EPQDDVTTGIDVFFYYCAPVDVYTIQGVLIKTQVAPVEALRDLDCGIYILRAGDKAIKVLR